MLSLPCSLSTDCLDQARQRVAVPAERDRRVVRRALCVALRTRSASDRVDPVTSKHEVRGQGDGHPEHGEQVRRRKGGESERTSRPVDQATELAASRCPSVVRTGITAWTVGLKKVLPAGMAFPYDFGFLPKTAADDGDPIDVLLLMDEPAFPGVLVPSRLIGVIEGEQVDGNKRIRNDRLVAIERVLTASGGLPNRPWFQHMIYAPGLYTGYGVKTLPAVRESIEQKQWKLAEESIAKVGKVLENAGETIQGAAVELERAIR